jgi:hypothetical protein
VDGQAEDHSSVAQPAEFWDDDVANMPAHTLKKHIERMPNRNPADYSRSDKSEEKGRGNMVRRKVYTPLLLREDLKIAAEWHAFLVVMKEVPDFWRSRSVRSQKFLLLVSSR